MPSYSTFSWVLFQGATTPKPQLIPGNTGSIQGEQPYVLELGLFFIFSLVSEHCTFWTILLFPLRYVMLSSGYLHHHYTTTNTATPTTCPSIGDTILLMSIMSVCKDVTLLEEQGDMAIHRYVKLSCYWGERDIAIGRISKDVMLLRKKWGKGYSELYKGVTFLGEKKDIAIMRVLQDVRLLGEKVNMTILRVHKDVITG